MNDTSLWLLHATLHAGAGAALALAASALLRRRGAAVRHAALLAGLAVVLASPVTAVVATRTGRPVLVLPGSPESRSAPAGPVPDGSAAAGAPALAPTPAPSSPASPPPATASGSPPAPASPPPSPAPSEGPDLEALVPLAWAAISLLLLLRVAGGLLRQAAWRRRARPAAIPAAVVSGAAGAAGLQDPPDVLESDDVGSPASIGVFRPAVLLNRGLAERIGAGATGDVLAHEFAHVRRRDPLVALLAAIATALHWPNPLVHLLARRRARLAEVACDNAGIAHRGPTPFGRTLVAVASAAPGDRRLPAGMAAPRWPLADRVRGLLAPDRDRSIRAGRGLAAALAAGALLLAGALLAGRIARGEGESDGAGPALPEVLVRRGFADPAAPITVVFVAPIGDEESHPKIAGTDATAPANTIWVFEDPGPVRAVLAKARTRSFDEGRYPGAKARITIFAGPEGASDRVHLAYRPGFGVVISDRAEGGDWRYDPAADRALVELLSRTPPRAIGHSSISVTEATFRTDPGSSEPQIRTVNEAADWARLVSRLRTRYRTADFRLPASFDWKTHFVAVAWLPARDTRDRLDWSGARLSRGVVTWELREDREEEPAEGWVPVTVAVFPRPEMEMPWIAMRLDGRIVARTPVPGRLFLPGDPGILGVLILRTKEGRETGRVSIYEDRSYRYAPESTDPAGAGYREGRLPEAFADTLVDGIGSWGAVQLGTLFEVAIVDGDGPFPPGVEPLLDHLGVR